MEILKSKEEDDGQVYLHTFEQVATHKGWHEGDWAQIPRLLLSGEAKLA